MIPEFVIKMAKFNVSKVSILTLVATLVVSSLLFGKFATSTSAQSAGKVYVCKYVGTPGVDETLQTGQNPIEVSVNAVDDATVGSYFNDAHGRSYVLGTVPMNPEPTAEDCPQTTTSIQNTEQDTEALSCSINTTPSFNPGNNFIFGQTYNFSATTTGNVLNYLWSITPGAPPLSSTNSSTTSWTAPLVPAPGVTWILTLNVSDDSDNSDSCSIEFIDPADPSPTPTPGPTNSSTETNGQVLGASTMATTGGFEENLYLSIMGLGAILTFKGIKKTYSSNR